MKYFFETQTFLHLYMIMNLGFRNIVYGTCVCVYKCLFSFYITLFVLHNFYCCVNQMKDNVAMEEPITMYQIGTML